MHVERARSDRERWDRAGDFYRLLIAPINGQIDVEKSVARPVDARARPPVAN